MAASVALCITACKPLDSSVGESPSAEEVKALILPTLNDQKSLQMRNVKRFAVTSMTDGKTQTPVICGEIHFRTATGEYSPWMGFWGEHSKTDGHLVVIVGELLLVNGINSQDPQKVGNLPGREGQWESVQRGEAMPADRYYGAGMSECRTAAK